MIEIFTRPCSVAPLPCRLAVKDAATLASLWLCLFRKKNNTTLAWPTPDAVQCHRPSPVSGLGTSQELLGSASLAKDIKPGMPSTVCVFLRSSSASSTITIIIELLLLSSSSPSSLCGYQPYPTPTQTTIIDRGKSIKNLHYGFYPSGLRTPPRPSIPPAHVA